METRHSITNTNHYHEDQLIFILMSHKYRVNRLQKIISRPIFDDNSQIPKERSEVNQILKQLGNLGWHVPCLAETV